MTKRTCTNPSCSMRNQTVDTNRSTCLTCGRSLTSPFSDLLGGLFGDSLPGTRQSKIPEEVLTALRDADDVLSWFLSGAPVKRKDLEVTHAQVVEILRRFG